MFWYGHVMNGGTGLFMILLMVLVWMSLVAACAVLINGVRRRPDRGTPEEILGRRYARGELSDVEYRRRMDQLRTH